MRRFRYYEGDDKDTMGGFEVVPQEEDPSKLDLQAYIHRGNKVDVGDMGPKSKEKYKAVKRTVSKALKTGKMDAKDLRKDSTDIMDVEFTGNDMKTVKITSDDGKKSVKMPVQYEWRMRKAKKQLEEAGLGHLKEFLAITKENVIVVFGEYLYSCICEERVSGADSSVQKRTIHALADKLGINWEAITEVTQNLLDNLEKNDGPNFKESKMQEDEEDYQVDPIYDDGGELATLIRRTAKTITRWCSSLDEPIIGEDYDPEYDQTTMCVEWTDMNPTCISEANNDFRKLENHGIFFEMAPSDSGAFYGKKYFFYRDPNY